MALTLTSFPSLSPFFSLFLCCPQSVKESDTQPSSWRCGDPYPSNGTEPPSLSLSLYCTPEMDWTLHLLATGGTSSRFQSLCPSYFWPSSDPAILPGFGWSARQPSSATALRSQLAPDSSIPGSPPSGARAQWLCLDLLLLPQWTRSGIMPGSFWDSLALCQIQKQSRMPLASSHLLGYSLNLPCLRSGRTQLLPWPPAPAFIRSAPSLVPVLSQLHVPSRSSLSPTSFSGTPFL